jgi:hypothetical protein
MINTMKNHILFFFFVLISLALNAQNATISGHVARSDNNPISGVTINAVDASGNIAATAISQANGDYALTGLSVPASYYLSFSYNTSPVDGVSTYDIVLGARHILAIESLTSPYAILAADVNGNGAITTLDLVFMRKVVLAIDQSFPIDSWTFLPANLSDPNPQSPANAIQLTGDLTGLNFTGVKIGDLEQ